MGKAQRRKGHDFERHVAKLFRRWYPDARRGFQSRGGSAEEPDVLAGPYGIECKKGKQPPIWKGLEQAKAHKGTKPLLVFKKDYDITYVTMPWEIFSTLMDLAQNDKQCNLIEVALDD